MNDKNLQSQDVEQDVQAYINYYGLTGDPFNPVNPVFFATPQLEKLLRLFNYLARFSRKLVVVTGDDDAGKTALLEHYVNGQDKQELLCFFSALSSDTPKQVLYEIASQLGIDTNTESETVEQLTKVVRDYALQRVDQDMSCLVVIDDAHLFEKPVLELLYQLSFDVVGQRSAISILLGGQQSLIEKLQVVVPPEDRSKTLFHQPIAPFNHDEMVQYLKLHFKENAGQKKPPFSIADYQQIYQQSAGFPGRINEQAKQLLIAGASRSGSGGETNNHSKLLFALVGVILLIMGGGFWWSNYSQDESNTDVAGLEMTGKVERIDEAAQKGGNDSRDAQVFSKYRQQLDSPDIKPSDNADELVSNSDKHEQLNTSMLENTASESHDEASVVDDTNNAETAAAGSPEIEKTEIEKSKTQEKLEENVVAPSTTASASTSAEQVPERVPEVVPQSSKPASALSRNIDSILALPASEYTLQLLGSRKEKSIITAKAKIPGFDNMLYFEKQHKGAPWYVLIYGHYDSRAAANTAAAKLTAKIKGIKPWIRKISAIQATIKKNQ